MKACRQPFCLKCQALLTFHTAHAQRGQAFLSSGNPVLGGWREEKVADISGPSCSTLDRAWDRAIHGINHYFSGRKKQENQLRYPVDSDLCDGQRYPTFEQSRLASSPTGLDVRRQRHAHRGWLHSPLDMESLLAVYENGMYYIHCTHFLFILENTYSEVNTYLWGRVTIFLVLIKNELIKGEGKQSTIRQYAACKLFRLGYCKLRNDKLKMQNGNGKQFILRPIKCSRLK